MKKLLCLCLLFVASFSLFACNSEKEDTTTTTKNNSLYKEVTFKPESVDTTGINFVNKGKLTVAVSTDFAPMEFINLNEQGQKRFAGADIEFAKAIAKAFGVEIHFKAMDFDSTMIALDSKTADVAISGFSWTADRAASYLYSECYYAEGDGGHVAVIRKEDADKYKSLADLNKEGVKVAAQNGSLQLDIVVDELKNATLVKVDDLNSAYDKLTSKALDAVAVAQSVASTLVEKFPDKYVICEETFKFVDGGNFALVQKDNTALKNAIDKVIAQFEDDTFEIWKYNANVLFNSLGENVGEEIFPEDE